MGLWTVLVKKTRDKRAFSDLEDTEVVVLVQRLTRNPYVLSFHIRRTR